MVFSLASIIPALTYEIPSSQIHLAITTTNAQPTSTKVSCIVSMSILPPFTILLHLQLHKNSITCSTTLQITTAPARSTIVVTITGQVSAVLIFTCNKSNHRRTCAQPT
ncbi:pollen-specific leucine-rich repeat extensin-like protein 3 [Iris pallida]|uniref:Pollen-specific leucine-rich repeat extensin-like protein 3 n=1 Tax=Iris pallida TaxID=29817 RepID=A0AAX6IC70_IRIPA|nr:pollen-specific leucine-rich repeat extensin-like protein 3 [Iris pallida]